jgi:hypothetical protein
MKIIFGGVLSLCAPATGNKIKDVKNAKKTGLTTPENLR